jgi:hypothetical protein
MIFYGLNVAAFKLPIDVPHQKLWNDCQRLSDCFLPHNMQTGGDIWETAAIKAAMGNWRLTDPGFYRHLPELSDCNDSCWKSREEYMRYWAYTELAVHAPDTWEFCMGIENLGSFMTGARFLKVHPGAMVKYHWDNNPGKEFRVTVGLHGMENEEFVIQTDSDKFETIPMKAGEAWFVDIGLGHAVHNTGTADRYRLGMQYYSPSSDVLLDLFTKSENIIYAEQLKMNPSFDNNT